MDSARSNKSRGKSYQVGATKLNSPHSALSDMFSDNCSEEYLLSSDRRKNASRSRVCCYGNLVTGPASKQIPSIIANIYVIFQISLQIILLLQTDQEELQNSSFVYMGLFLCILTEVFVLLVMCTDPGIQERSLNYYANRLEEDYMSLEVYEREAFRLDQITSSTDLYKPRQCKTCLIQKLPKVSHCAVCNNCVRGYDHHCTLLNNCIGRRNSRYFFILLCLAGLANLYVIAEGIVILVLQKDKEDIVIMSIALGLFILKVIIFYSCKCYSNDLIRFLLPFIIDIGIIISISVLADLVLWIGGVFMAFGSTYCLIAKDMTFLRCYLVTHHLTEKELAARESTRFMLGSEQDEMVTRLSCKDQTYNIYRFFCGKRRPTSHFKRIR